MSQQYDYPLPLPPPPPPPPGAFVTSGAGAVPGAQGPSSAGPPRSRPVSGVFQSQFVASNLHARSSPAQTPTTGPYLPGTPLQYSPHTPSGLNPHTQAQASSPRSPVMEPYNPRQWTNRGQVSGSQMVFQARGNNASSDTRDVTGMEASMPSPPPPYSPATPERLNRPATVSPRIDTTTLITPQSAIPQSAIEITARNSPQVPMSPAFPPPPGASSRHRDRSLSGLGGQRSFFNLAGLRGKQPAVVEPQSAQASNAVHNLPFAEPRPPAARRAASAGQMGPHNPMASSSVPGPASRTSPEVRWQPGMPLPPPPPGPPPAGARSQSLNRPVGVPTQSASSSRELEVPRHNRAAASPGLGPIPPTPADWVEGDASNAVQPTRQTDGEQQGSSSNSDASQPLRIDTGTHQDSSLTRRPARRDNSAQGIRERRSRSRAAKGSEDLTSAAAEDRPRNLIFSTVDGSISRRREHNRTISGLAGPSSAPSSIEQPHGTSAARATTEPADTVLTPPYTPAVGKRAEEGLRKQPTRVPGSASSDRPISHLLHAPNEDAANLPAPLSPARPPSSSSMKTSTRLDAFALQAIERHRVFVEKEAAASSDEERLELFANYIVHESRLRRDRYTAAYNAMAGDIVDLTRDMWRSYMRDSKRAQTPSTSMSSFDPTVPSWASDGQPASAHGHMPSSASSFGESTPNTDAGSNGDVDGFERAEGRPWAEAFKPSLSPIPSMAVSTVPDEDSSRGRTASRWWEQSNSGSGSIGKPDRMEKSRRETKYMGVSAASLASTGDSSNPTRGDPTPATSSHDLSYGADEYPPEKVGWHEPADFDTPLPTPHRQAERKATTPGVEPTDISRLITLPPPYPRHHPALSNSHPRLAGLRSELRLLAQHDEIQKIKDKYLDQDFSLQREQQEAAKKRRNQLRSDIQSKIADGSMSFADAANAEAEFDAADAERGKQDARASFDLFETSVAHPLNALLTDRLKRADDCIKSLRDDLDSGNDAPDPNQAQEEGDEQPERLEKLTLLKWIFETRELLHKEMFDLHAMRSDKYSEVILAPYRISKAQAKFDEATAFFKKDNTERQIGLAKDSLKRLEQLQNIMDKNVSRGVEDQLSAFWDIAPGLLEVIQHVPARMAGFEIQVPPAEYEENPAYLEHPLQYLYSLLGHAEKSAYQLIESQTNLLCLLHEVRTATTKSSLRLVELERNAASPDDAEICAEMDQARKEADRHLTRDLKEKVGEVERQWREALGRQLDECRGRVRAWLEASGGLEDGLDG